MLFDLRGRGRRRTVQVIYLSLALLLGGGLVLFGIGGDVQGGLFDAFCERQRVGQRGARGPGREGGEAASQANRQDAAAWAALARAKYHLAGQTDGFNARQHRRTFTGESREVRRRRHARVGAAPEARRREAERRRRRRS